MAASWKTMSTSRQAIPRSAAFPNIAFHELNLAQYIGNIIPFARSKVVKNADVRAVLKQAFWQCASR